MCSHLTRRFTKNKHVNLWRALLTPSLSGCHWACPPVCYMGSSASPLQTGHTPDSSPASQTQAVLPHQIWSCRKSQKLASWRWNMPPSESLFCFLVHLGFFLQKVEFNFYLDVKCIVMPITFLKGKNKREDSFILIRSIIILFSG